MPQRYNRSRMYGRGYRQYDPTYQAAGFNPAVFEGTSMEFKPYDYSIYERGLANLEARMNKAAEEQGAVDLTLAEIETKLNPAEREWFAGYKQDIKNQIQGDIDAGNFGTAIRKAIKLGNQAASDSRITGRVEANAKYQEELKKQKDRLAKGDITDDAFSWWLKKNPYTYQDKYDANGNVVSGTLQEFTPLYDKVDYAGLTNAAFKLITANKGSSSRDGSTSVHNTTTKDLSRGNTTYKPGENVSGSSHSSESFEYVSLDDIKDNIEELIALNPGGLEQVEQDYVVRLDAFKELEEKYNKALEEDPTSENTRLLGQQLEVRKKLLFRNGSETDFKDYFARMLADNMIAKNMAYDWRTTASGGTSSYSLSDVNSNNNNGGGSGNSSTNTSTNTNTSSNWRPPMIIKQDGGINLVDDIDRAAKSAGSRF